MDQERQEGMRPQGRARGLIAVWEQVQREERTRVRRRGIWTPMVGGPGRGRAVRLALMREIIAQNVAVPPGHPNANPVMGEGMGLTSQLLSYPTSGMGRAKVRNPGPHPSPEPPLFLPYSKPQYLIRDPLEMLSSPPSS